jgi:hypothetical protein
MAKRSEHPLATPVSMMPVASLIIVAILCGCATQPTPPSVADVVGMSKKGTGAHEIIDKMRESRGVYRIAGSEFAALKSEGVPDSVLDYMLQTYLRAERERQAQYCTMGPPYDVVK